jgi:hypothetical protein
MRKVWKIVGIAAVIAILGAAAIGAVALAQDTEDGANWPFNFQERFREAIANVLGISTDEYDAAVETAQGQVLDQAVTEGWLTEDQAQQMQERMAEGFGSGMAPGMRGDKFGGMRGGHGGFIGGPDNSLMSVAAEALDLSVKDLMTELQDGKSIADVAGEKSVDVQTIADTYLAQLAETLKQAVTDGKLTQTRADWMLEQETAQVQQRLAEPFEFDDCGPGGFHGRPGMMRPGGDLEDSSSENDA